MTPSPVEFVKSLSRVDRAAVLESLIESIYADRGPFVTVPLTNASGQPLGILLPHDSDPEWIRMLSEMPHEMRDNVLKPPPADFDPDDCLTEDELEELTQKAIAEAQRSELAEPAGETIRGGIS